MIHKFFSVSKQQQFWRTAPTPLIFEVVDFPIFVFVHPEFFFLLQTSYIEEKKCLFLCWSQVCAKLKLPSRKKIAIEKVSDLVRQSTDRPSPTRIYNLALSFLLTS